MREYLFELRKKANKTQMEINKIFSEKYNCKVPYSLIETGTYWKELSGRRAEMLADALEVSSDYILDCEKKYGGFVGIHHLSNIDNPHRIRNARRNDYDEPLSKEEQQLAIEYYPYAEKIINICRNKYYKPHTKSFMTYEDFYDIGILAYLRSIKKLSVKHVENADFMSNIEEPDYYYRHWFSDAIKKSYISYIRAEKTLRRKNFYNSMMLDSTKQDKEGNEIEQYNFVPSKDLPISLVAESSWSLDRLYKYLTNEQIFACKLLIAEWTIPEVIKGGYATKRDIGVIRLYLTQLKKYGKILWVLEKFRSDAPNVHYDLRHNRWVVNIAYKAKNYYLGEYSDLNTALDLHTLLHFHMQKGDFLQWFESHLKPHTNGSMAFTYPLSYESEVDALDIIDTPHIISKRRGGTEFVHATRESPKGITFQKKRNTYAVYLGSYGFGTYKTFDEAFEIRQLAEAHYHAGDFDLWYADFTAKRKKKHLPYTRLDKRCRNGKVSYTVARGYQYKTITLGTYSYEEALRVKSLADSHIDAGDFDEWSKKFYDDYLAESKVKKYSAMSKSSKKTKPFFPYAAVYVICKYVSPNYILLCYDTKGSEHTIGEMADVEEAYKTMDLANEHIEAGDFDVWLADYKNIKTEE